MIWRVLSLVVALFAAMSLTFAPVLAPNFNLTPAFAGDDDDDDDDDDDAQRGNERPRARLLIADDPQMPGRMILDASLSQDRNGENRAGEIVSHTYRVFDIPDDDDDGDDDDDRRNLVFGPVVLEADEVALDEAFIRVVLPAGRYKAVVDVEDDQGRVSRARRGFLQQVEVIVGSSASCSPNSDKSVYTCTPSDSLTEVDLNDVLSLVPGASTSTPIVFRAYGARGGGGTGCHRGKGGNGGPAQTATTIADYESLFGTSIINYFLGKSGGHSESGGSGGASTIVSSSDGSAGFTIATSETQTNILLVAGGAGGGGAGDTNGSLGEGTHGGNGGCAIATDTPDFPAGTTGNGESGSDSGGGGGGFGGSCAEGACGGAGGKASGHNGKNGQDAIGGQSGGATFRKTASSKGWTNGTPSGVGSDGQGGEGTFGSGGGGGGYGGGGAGGVKSSATRDTNYGGGGGGSHAAVATVAPVSEDCSDLGNNSGDGDFIMKFYLN